VVTILFLQQNEFVTVTMTVVTVTSNIVDEGPQKSGRAKANGTFCSGHKVISSMPWAFSTTPFYEGVSKYLCSGCPVGEIC